MINFDVLREGPSFDNLVVVETSCSRQVVKDPIPFVDVFMMNRRVL